MRIFNFTSLFILFFSISCHAFNGDLEIYNDVDGKQLTITTCDHDAGAICSLVWDGVEFIDDYDHGRQLQSAVSYDWLGEAVNPTEAGASYLTDGINPNPSSSEILYKAQTQVGLITNIQMAYWNPVSGVALSDVVLQKIVTIGYSNWLDNVIKYTVTFDDTSNAAYSHGQYEVLTGYMPDSFSVMQAYNLDTGALSTLTNCPGEQTHPIIFSTPNGSHAMGIYNPRVPQAAYPNAGYGCWDFPADDVVKWNTVERQDNPAPSYTSTVYVIVGTRDSVKTDIARLHGLGL